MTVPLSPTSGREKRIGLFTPFALVPGGGARYLLAMAATLQAYGQVELVAPEIYSQLRVRQMVRDLGLKLQEPLPVVRQPAEWLTKPYDLFVAMGNEAVPPAPGLGRVNLFMCQFPFPASGPIFQLQRGYDPQYTSIVVNSRFTLRTLQRERRRLEAAPSDLVVVNPPCRVPERPPRDRPFDGVIRIASVGRFFTSGHAKRQDALISALRQLIRTERGAIRYELHLIGAAAPQWGSRGYIEALERKGAGLPVTLYPNATIERLQSILETSDVYWHAAGLGTSARRHPERLEHFGIAVVEAMGAGCVPIVFGAGGPLEIVEVGRTGYVFSSVRGLLEATRRHSEIVRDDHARARAWRQAVWSAAQGFSDAAFRERFGALVEPLLHRC